HRREELLHRAGQRHRRTRGALSATRAPRTSLLRSRLRPQPDGTLGGAPEARQPGRWRARSALQARHLV
ncbi:uncharacterized protein METZ01_LOCUS452321, partial [marine metagenome]